MSKQDFYILVTLDSRSDPSEVILQFEDILKISNMIKEEEVARLISLEVLFTGNVQADVMDPNKFFGFGKMSMSEMIFKAEMLVDGEEIEEENAEETAGTLEMEKVKETTFPLKMVSQSQALEAYYTVEVPHRHCRIIRGGEAKYFVDQGLDSEVNIRFKKLKTTIYGVLECGTSVHEASPNWSAKDFLTQVNEIVKGRKDPEIEFIHTEVEGAISHTSVYYWKHDHPGIEKTDAQDESKID